MASSLRTVAAAAVVLLASACSTHASGSATPLSDVAEHLTFAGALRGTLTSGVNVLSHSTKNPDASAAMPSHTQCSLFKVDDVFGEDYVATVVGTVAGRRAALMVEINADQAAYTAPGTRLEPGDTNQGGSATLQLAGDTDGRPSVVGPAAQEPAVITLAADRRSGSIDAWFADAGMSQKGSPATVHVSGTWRCG